MSRIGSLGLDGFGSGFVSPQPHRQTVPAGQQQHVLTDSAGPPHVCRSSDIPPIGIASDVRMPNTERMTSMLAHFLRAATTLSVSKPSHDFVIFF
jgi:hypothetical protein